MAIPRQSHGGFQITLSVPDPGSNCIRVTSQEHTLQAARAAVWQPYADSGFFTEMLTDFG